MADRLLGGRLLELLREYRRQQLGTEAIASRLYAEAGVEVSGETVRRWCLALGIPLPKSDEGVA
jgi:hypothetical protein